MSVDNLSRRQTYQVSEAAERDDEWRDDALEKPLPDKQDLEPNFHC